MDVNRLKTKTLLYVRSGEENHLKNFETNFKNIICLMNTDKLLNDYFSNNNFNNFDILILDISITGFDIVKDIREKDSNIPIILLSDNFSKISPVDTTNQNIFYCASFPLVKEKILEKSYYALKAIGTQRFNTYLNQVAIIIRTDIYGTVIYANDKFSEVTGYKKNEIIGQNQNVIKHAKTSDTTYKELWENISQGKTWNGVLKNQKKNGEEYYVNMTIFPILDMQNTIKEYLAIKFIITNEKEQITKLKKYIMEQKSEQIKQHHEIELIVQEKSKSVVKNEIVKNDQLRKIVMEQEYDLNHLKKDKLASASKISSLESEVKKLRHMEQDGYIQSKVRVKKIADLNIDYQRKIDDLEKKDKKLQSKFEKAQKSVTIFQGYIDEYRKKIEDLRDVIASNEKDIKELKEK